MNSLLLAMHSTPSLYFSNAPRGKDPRRKEGGFLELTPAELQVANLIVGGSTIAESRAKQHIAPGTMGTHRSNIYKAIAQYASVNPNDPNSELFRQLSLRRGGAKAKYLPRVLEALGYPVEVDDEPDV